MSNCRPAPVLPEALPFSTRLALRALFSAHFAMASNSGAFDLESGLVSLMAFRTSSPVRSRSWWKAVKSPLTTASSSSAPLKPADSAAIWLMSLSAKSSTLRPYFWMWMRKMSARSLSEGKSTKKISSKRPLRSSSGGSPSIRLTVAMTKQGLVFSCIQERKFPKTLWLVPPSVVPLPPHAGKGFLHFINPKNTAPDRFGGLYGQPHVALRFADQAAEDAADVEADQRHRPN